MRYLLIVCLLFSGSGCVTTLSEEKIKESLKLNMPLQQAQVSQQRIAEIAFLQKAGAKKAAFLMAFQKLGFDIFEVLKLMERGDEDNLKAFMEKNRDILLLRGDLAEIISGPKFGNLQDRIWERLIQHLELNYKFYLGTK